MRKHWKLKKPVAVVTSIALAFSLAVAPGVASARVAQDGLAVGATAISDVPEWAVDDGSNASALTAQAALPSKYDLRSDGLVTPVKSQSPWQTCWAFAGIAAAETSMLSATGSKYDKQTNDVDLSERHLAYFALHPVTEVDDPAQAGEGMYTMSSDRNAAFDAGGLPVYITTLFSQGVGPQAEAMFPYRGVDAQGESRLGTQAFESDPEGTTLLLYASTEGMTADEYKEKLEKEARDTGSTYAEVLKPKREEAKKYCENDHTYFYLDDWTIPATDGSGNSNRTLTPFMTLRDGNVLPEYQNDDNTPNDQSIAAMKQELVNGHGVTIAYKPDKARPSESGDSRYINRDTWAQYTFERADANHAVCIVGYDDGYSKDNFTHTVYKKDAAGNPIVDDEGKPIVDDDATAASTPPGNGAWIVRNSWGSETDKTKDDLGNVINNGTYGVRDENGKATGYFYLSYYDKNISQVETMAFSPDLLEAAGDYEVLQHDYMPAQSGFYTTPATADVTSSANVFEAPQDLSIKAVSTRTSEENQRVTFAIYELKDGATEPTDGTMLYRTSRNFEYAGFHRLDLDWAIDVKAGKKIAVVSTASTLGSDGTRRYSASANQAFSKQSVEFLNGLNYPVKLYGEAVVNEGESFLYSNGQWVDWSKHIAALPKSTEKFASVAPFPGDTYIEQFPIDNFSIKLYAVPADQNPVDLSAAEVAVEAATYSGGAPVEPKVTVKLGGAELRAGSDYAVSYVNNKKAGSAVAVVKGKGSYTGSAAKAFTIAKAANTMKAVPKAKVNKVKLSKLKKETQVIAKAKAFKVTKAKGKVTFKKAKGNKKIAVSKAGKVTVKKGLKKGTYKVKVKVTAAGNANYKKATKTVTLKVKVA
ncbi:MAG TPA: hypothetical protein DCP91_08240 [Eggerthellaceae bacterium]|nr:hypothetical protein [Eggerthellaceae bacterium]